VSTGWRWTHRKLLPEKVEPVRKDELLFPTGWARTRAGRVAREVIHAAGFAHLTRWEVDITRHGLEVLDDLEPPVVFVANHTSHLDTAVLRTTLPFRWRDRTVIGAAADYFFDVWWRGIATSLIFNGFPVERERGLKAARLAKSLLDDGWNILIYPEGGRSEDGWMNEFKGGGAWLAVEAQVPVVPIAFRGNFQAMPKGRGWPVKGRPPVSIRFGTPVVPAPGERARVFNERVKQALAMTLDEDATNWWGALSRAAKDEVPSPSGPEGARWRRVWDASRPLPDPDDDLAWPK
ncbi:MAG: lysophospholipid acyltransferase family protein, partial [Actinomycetota bacterium]